MRSVERRFWALFLSLSRSLCLSLSPLCVPRRGGKYFSHTRILHADLYDFDPVHPSVKLRKALMLDGREDGHLNPHLKRDPTLEHYPHVWRSPSELNKEEALIVRDAREGRYVKDWWGTITIAVI